MRFAVFVFSLVLVVMPAYVHAIVFVPAITGALVRTASGAVVKVANKKTLATAVVGLGVPFAIDYCKKHPKKCKDWVGDAAEWLFDDDNTDNQDMCYYVEGAKDKPTYKKSDACKVTRENHRLSGYKLEFYNVGNGYCRSTVSSDVYPIFTISCDTKRKIDSEKLAKKIAEHLLDDDPDYIINNYGDTINIEQYCLAHACDELTAEFGDEVMKNKSKYDIDKINKANCEVENNKIKSCDKAKKQLELDFEAESEQPKDEDTDPTPKGDKTDDIDCDSSKFHKKICQFISWTQTDDDPPQDTKLDIDEPDAPKNKDPNINFVGTCPAPYVLEFVIDFGFIGRKDVSITLLDTPKLCNFLDTWVAPIMLFVGPLHAIYILGGGSREI